jgi:hypothetical protein
MGQRPVHASWSRGRAKGFMAIRNAGCAFEIPKAPAKFNRRHRDGSRARFSPTRGRVIPPRIAHAESNLATQAVSLGRA